MDGLIILMWLACGGLSAYIAQQKNRNVGLWAIMGFLFGIIGVLIIALLSKVEDPPQNYDFNPQKD